MTEKCAPCKWVDSAALHPRYAEHYIRTMCRCESFACAVCGQPNAQHHPTCPRNGGVSAVNGEGGSQEAPAAIQAEVNATPEQQKGGK